MTDPVITSAKAFVIERDVRCRGCAYNLRGLSSHGRCPECNVAIGESLTDTFESFFCSLPDDARRNLRVEVLHEPYGIWITCLPFLLPFGCVALGAGIGMTSGPWGILLGIIIGLFMAILLGRWLIEFLLRTAICRYLKKQSLDNRLDRCPLCYHDLSGKMMNICPECGCPTCVRRSD